MKIELDEEEREFLYRITNRAKEFIEMNVLNKNCEYNLDIKKLNIIIDKLKNNND